MANREFILLIKEHHILGQLFTPVFIKKKDGFEFYTIERNITINDLNNSEFEFTEAQQKIIKITEQYHDVNIAKMLAPKTNVHDFFANITPELLSKRVQPYIERRLSRCINLAKETEIRIFIKNLNLASLFDEDEIKIMPNKAQTVFNFERTGDGINYFLSVGYDTKEIKLTHRKAEIFSLEPCWLLLNNRLYNFDDIDGKKLIPFFEKEYINVPKRLEHKYFDTFIFNSVKNYKVNAKGFEIVHLKPEKIAEITLEKDFTKDLILILRFKYGNHLYLYEDGKNVYCKKKFVENSYQFEKYRRDLEWENTCCDFFLKKGLKKEGTGKLVLPVSGESGDEDNTFVFLNWINSYTESIEEAGIKFSQNVGKKKFHTGFIELDLNVKQKRSKDKRRVDWFDIHATVQIGKFSIPFLRFRNNILRNNREYILPDGKVAILPEEWFSQYRDLFITGEEIMGHISISAKHFTVLNEDMRGIDKNYLNELKKLENKKQLKKQIIPQLIKANLREYQETGFSWMYSLFEHSLGACLADDMGLGKTLQAITLLSKCIENKDNIKTIKGKVKERQLFLFDEFTPQNTVAEDTETAIQQASLIVMPVSLLHNWFAEIKKFAPHLRTLIYSGVNRKNEIDKLFDYDVVLSSYGTVRNDYIELSKYEFFYLILDESQFIKNPQSKTYQTIIKLPSLHKLVITGTPIENSLVDLWSQINFINEGLLGGLDFFKKEFVTPIEKHSDEIKSQRLQKLIQPFILRRTKSEVAKDLPPLTEQILYCTMPPDQASIYEKEKSKARNAIMDLIETKELNKSGIIILEALMRLRMFANHPKMKDPFYKGEAGKFNEAIRNIESLIAEGHKVLIFSSFVKHLNIFAEYFDEQNMEYSLLTGATTKRKEAVAKFENTPSVKLFLISIKAGGVGLNLTSASYVFILDPWWNPAVESQAINRAHRIGQDKKVFVYRYITLNTIEERILNLQRKKSNLANTFINTNNPFAALDTDEIENLFL